MATAVVCVWDRQSKHKQGESDRRAKADSKLLNQHMWHTVSIQRICLHTLTKANKEKERENEPLWWPTCTGNCLFYTSSCPSAAVASHVRAAPAVLFPEISYLWGKRSYITLCVTHTQRTCLQQIAICLMKASVCTAAFEQTTSVPPLFTAWLELNWQQA